MKVKFKPLDLKIVEPPYSSPLTDLAIDLDGLRKKRLGGTTDPDIFFQLKGIFHTLESIGSARIEGNRTTVSEFIETKINNPKSKDEKIIEIQNGEKALAYIDEYIEKGKGEINRAFLGNLHKKVVEGLTPPPTGEGSSTPGEYRKMPVSITGSSLVNPDYVQVPDYMEELLNFFNKQDAPKYDLLKIAIAHHRFAWIHPFDNGNGRTVRLLTYAMLVKQGFNVHIGRIINPTAVFCNDRDEYYKMLSKADTGTDEGVLEWCEYVLGGLKSEIEKIDKLLDYKYLSVNILMPTVAFALERKLITDDEAKILRIAVKEQIFQASDIKPEFSGKIPAEISRMIRRLKEKKMIAPESGKSRKYVLCFANNYLLRGVIEALDKNNFLPLPLNK
ncbi:MAG: Fic family protein [Minisyncoccota bacterium]